MRWPGKRRKAAAELQREKEIQKRRTETRGRKHYIGCNWCDY
jgi:hypothetical protein